MLRTVLVLVGLLWFGALPVEAQSNLNLERFRPAYDAQGFLTLQGSYTPKLWHWNVGLFGSYMTQVGGTGPVDASKGHLVDHRLTTTALAQLGLWKGLALAADIPVLLYQQSDGNLRSQAFGDPRIALRYRVWGSDRQARWGAPEGFGLGVMAAATIPGGGADALAGDGNATSELQAHLDYYVLGFGVGAMFGWQHRFAAASSQDLRWHDELQGSIALKAPLPPWGKLEAIFECGFHTDAKQPFAHRQSTVAEADLGVRYHISGWAISAIGGAGFPRGGIAPAARAVLGLTWTPQKQDADDDGVDDQRDQCPQLAEDRDGFQDADGCPDLDDDDDFVVDTEDRCPRQTAEEGRDANQDGCTDPR